MAKKRSGSAPGSSASARKTAKRASAGGSKARKSADPQVIVARRGITAPPRRAIATPTRIRPNIAAPVRPGVSVGPIVGGVVLDPGRFAQKSVTSLFDGAKAGRPVVRPDDLLALRIEVVNLNVVAGTPPTLARAGTGPARLILHFPPQSIAEEVFYEVPSTGIADNEGNSQRQPVPPPLDTGIGTPPVRARIAGESRLAFIVPDETGWSAEYTLAGVLAACRSLALDVVATARPREPRLHIGRIVDWLDASVRFIEKLAPAQRARLSALALRTLRIGALEGPAATPTLQLRAGLPGGLVPLEAAPSGRASSGNVSAAFARSRFTANITAAISGLRIRPDAIAARPLRFNRKPTAPGARQTAIEMPWRLVISPHGAARWQHAADAITSPLTQRTELWHTRLTTLDAKGTPIDYPKKDGNRTIRAVWALTGEGSNPATFNKDHPTPPEPPKPSNIPFRATLDDSDRFNIVHLSSNFSYSNYRPEVVDVNVLMLSSLGGWLDSRGAWEPPGDFAVEEWVHRASMSRDHYVRIVRKGFLFPFGHRVALVKVSERKFHPGNAGNPAVLRQRMFIVVRERERTYTATSLKNVGDGPPRLYHLQFPFPSVRILTTVTPDLADPAGIGSNVAGQGQLMFYPHIGNPAVPFRFRCAATDIDGRNVEFELPMIFIDNMLAAKSKLQGNAIVIDYDASKVNFDMARTEWRTPGRRSLREADLRLQKVALAASVNPGDTACDIQLAEFGCETDNLKSFARDNGGLQCYPAIARVVTRIPALAGLSGAAGTNTLKYEANYLAKGFDAANKGEVFMAIDAADPDNTANLDFSKQGDRSGGFVMPNLKPAGLSRVAGPVAGKLDQFAGGAPDPKEFFKELSPLLFGVIPLGDVIAAIASEAGSPTMPKFLTEAATKVESFINDLVRLLDLLRRLPDDGAAIGRAAAQVAIATLQDIEKQAAAQLDVGQAQVAQYLQRVQQARAELESFAAWLDTQTSGGANIALSNPAQLATKVGPALNRFNAVLTSVPGPVPAGFKQSVANIAQRSVDLLNALNDGAQLVDAGKQLLAALEGVVGDPSAIAGIFGDAAQLLAKLTAVRDAIAAFRPLLAGNHLIDGAPKQTLLSVIDVLTQMFDVALASIETLQELFGGEEIVIRFDWKPELANWALPGANPATEPLFRANDKHGFVVAVEGRVKRNGTGTPKINVVCSLKHFDLVLINPAGFLELNFEKIEFRADSAMKMNVDVLLTDIKFIGVLSFVETLRDLIPLDGFSDPPYLDITAQGIDAGFNVALPNIAVGIFSLTNLSLGAGFSVPFIGQPLSVRFNFCTREQPFNLTVSLFGGGGFFGITVDPSGVQILEASLEFGASISIDFGVASGGVHVMAGIYFRMEQDEAQLTGYFRLGGHVSVLGLVSASLELYLALRYEFATGKAVGTAQLTIEISIFMFSASVTITCERKFAGSNGDPSFAQLMGPEPGEVLTDTLVYPWREYCEAFA